MAIVKCPNCGDPNFDNGACGCGWCKKCKWRQTCTQGGWYAPDFDKGNPYTFPSAVPFVTDKPMGPQPTFGPIFEPSPQQMVYELAQIIHGLFRGTTIPELEDYLLKYIMYKPLTFEITEHPKPRKSCKILDEEEYKSTAPHSSRCRAVEGCPYYFCECDESE